MEPKNAAPGRPYVPASLAIHNARYMTAMQLVSGKKVLDISCGNGLGSMQMARDWGALSVTGVNSDQTAINAATNAYKTIKNLSFVNEEETAFLINTKEKFDVIVCIETIENIPEPKAFLEAIKTCLSTKGVAILSCTNDAFYYGPGASLNEERQSTFAFEDIRNLANGVLGTGEWLIGTKLSGFASVRLDETNKPAIANTVLSKTENFGTLSPVAIVGASDAHLLSPDTGIFFVGLFGVEKNDVKTTIGLISAAADYQQNIPGQFRQLSGLEENLPIDICLVEENKVAAEITIDSLRSSNFERFGFRLISMDMLRLDIAVPAKQSSFSGKYASGEQPKSSQIHFSGVAAFRKFLNFFDGDERFRHSATKLMGIANRKSGQIWSLGLDYPPYPELTVLELALLDTILIKQENGSNLKPGGKFSETSAELLFPHHLPEAVSNEREFMRVLLIAQKKGSVQFHALRMATLRHRGSQLSVPLEVDELDAESSDVEVTTKT